MFVRASLVSSSLSFLRNLLFKTISTNLALDLGNLHGFYWIICGNNSSVNFFKFIFLSPLVLFGPSLQRWLRKNEKQRKVIWFLHCAANSIYFVICRNCRHVIVDSSNMKVGKCSFKFKLFLCIFACTVII